MRFLLSIFLGAFIIGGIDLLRPRFKAHPQLAQLVVAEHAPTVLASAPAVLRQQVDKRAEAWLATTFSQRLDMRARDPGRFNYPIEVFSDWRGKAFYLCQIPSSEPSPRG